MAKRIATLLLGVGLIGLGAFFFIVPERHYALQLLARYWPIFLILAGLVRVAGHLIDRQPRSPVSGMMITAIGGILLASNLRNEHSLVQIVGNYWFWFLLAFTIGRVIKQYTHRIEDGRRPKAFSAGAVILILVLAACGLGANYLSRHGQDAGLNLHLDNFSDVRGYFLGRQLTIEDPQRVFAVPANSRIIIDSPTGDIEVAAAPQSEATARLVKRITAANEEEAKQKAGKIGLQFSDDNGVFKLNVSTAGLSEGFDTTIIVSLPESIQTRIDIAGCAGTVKLSGLRGDHTITHSESIKVEDHTGKITIQDASGAIELSRIRGEIDIARSTRNIEMRDISGKVQIKYVDGSVMIEDLKGAADIDSARDIRVTNFEGPVNAKSQTGRIEITATEKLTGDVKAVSERGGIRVDLPEDERFRFDAQSTSGRVRIRGFEQITMTRNTPSSVAGFNIDGSAPLVSLRSNGGEINVHSSGPASP